MPYLFSPNFKYQLDVNFQSQQLMIRKTRTQHVYMYIPNDLIRTTWQNMEGLAAIQIIFSRIKWHDEKTIRVLNEGNIDCLYEM